jgi:ClpA/ClpB-like protein
MWECDYGRCGQGNGVSMNSVLPSGLSQSISVVAALGFAIATLHPSPVQAVIPAQQSLDVEQRSLDYTRCMGESRNNQPGVRLNDAIRSRFSQTSVRVLFYARHELTLRPARAMTPEYILVGLLRAAPMIISASVNQSWTIGRIETALNLATEPGVAVLPEDVDIPFSPAVESLLRRSVESADELGSVSIEPGHLLLALLEDSSTPAAQVLGEAGLTRDRVVEVLKRGP